MASPCSSAPNCLPVKVETLSAQRANGHLKPELAAACEVWKEIKFEFDTIDKL
jgi:hypothetical protein